MTTENIHPKCFGCRYFISKTKSTHNLQYDMCHELGEINTSDDECPSFKPNTNERFWDSFKDIKFKVCRRNGMRTFQYFTKN